MQFIHVFHIILVMHSDYFFIQHNMVSLCVGNIIFYFNLIFKYYLYEFQMWKG